MLDLRYALRLLGQHKVVTAVAVFSLALGIGANTALFSLIDAMLLRSLPVPNPEQLVLFTWEAPQSAMRDFPGGLTFDGNRTDPATGVTTWNSFPYRTYELFAANNDTLTDLFAFARIYRANVVADGDARVGDGQLVSGNYFAALGVRMAAGRPIVEADDTASAAPVAVLGYRYWQQRFALDPGVVGRTLAVNDVAVTVVGIAPPEFSGTLQVEDSPDIYLPLAKEPEIVVNPFGASALRTPNWWWLQIMGRSPAGVAHEQVAAQFGSLFAQSVAETRGDRGAEFAPRLGVVSGSQGLHSSRERYAPAIVILIGIMALVLLAACANAASLLLARAATRQREIATRMAVGASSGRVLRQLLTESVLLALLSGALGVLLASWGRELLLKWGPWSVQSEQLVTHVDWRVLGFAFAVSLVTGVLFGVAPALRAVRSGNEAVQMKAGASAGTHRSKLARSLLTGQVAMSVVLLVGAGLFAQTLWNLKRVDLGFDASNLLLFRVDPALNRYDAPRFLANIERMIERLSQVEGLRGVTIAQRPLVAGGLNFGARNGSDMQAAMPGPVRWNFFATLGVPIVAGRGFEAGDGPSGPKVAVVNETFARRYFPDENAVGKKVWGDFDVVGVVKDTRLRTLRGEIPPAVFTVHTQEPAGLMTFQARFDGDYAELIPAIREIARQVDPNLAVYDFTTLEELIERTQLTQERLFAGFATVFAAVALFLVCVGLYGVVSYNVARRTHEIGIRMAIGARAADVRAMVLRETLVVLVAGGVIGVVAALFATRQLASMLFGLASADPATIVGAVAVLGAVAALAGYLPARRASRIDPLTALRYE
jgi:predicted permease